jgi:hypothetical protein
MNAWTSWWIGRPDEALDFARRAVATAERIPSSLSQAMARHALTLTHLLRGEPAEAAEVARENLDLATALDFPYWRGLAEMELGAALASLGDEQSLATIREAFDRLSTIGNAGGSPVGLALLADAYLAAGCVDDALGAVEIGLAMSELLGQPFCDTELLAARGRALLGLGRDREAFEAFEQSLNVGRRQRAASATLRTVVAFAPPATTPIARGCFSVTRSRQWATASTRSTSARPAPSSDSSSSRPDHRSYQGVNKPWLRTHRPPKVCHRSTSPAPCSALPICRSS